MSNENLHAAIHDFVANLMPIDMPAGRVIEVGAAEIWEHLSECSGLLVGDVADGEGAWSRDRTSDDRCEYYYTYDVRLTAHDGYDFDVAGWIEIKRTW